jgi:hypothetical protein
MMVNTMADDAAPAPQSPAPAVPTPERLIGVPAPFPRVNVSDAQPIAPPTAPVFRSPMSELEMAAVSLARWVLGLILIFGLGAFVAVAIGEYFAAPKEVESAQQILRTVAAQSTAASAPPGTLVQVDRLLTTIAEQREKARRVWIDLAQMLLLNLLLPVLTAILGYVFGAMKASAEPKSDS